MIGVSGDDSVFYVRLRQTEIMNAIKKFLEVSSLVRLDFCRAIVIFSNFFILAEHLRIS